MQVLITTVYVNRIKINVELWQKNIELKTTSYCMGAIPQSYSHYNVHTFPTYTSTLNRYFKIKFLEVHPPTGTL